MVQQQEETFEDLFLTVYCSGLGLELPSKFMLDDDKHQSTNTVEKGLVWSEPAAGWPIGLGLEMLEIWENILAFLLSCFMCFTFGNLAKKVHRYDFRVEIVDRLDAVVKRWTVELVVIKEQLLVCQVFVQLHLQQEELRRNPWGFVRDGLLDWSFWWATKPVHVAGWWTPVHVETINNTDKAGSVKTKQNPNDLSTISSKTEYLSHLMNVHIKRNEKIMFIY